MTEKNSFGGDELALFFAKKIENPIVIGEVKCSEIMYKEINKIGKAIMHKTGHSNIKVKLKELNAHLGAEVSGHLFFNDRYFGFDDAIYAALRVLEIIKEGLDLDEEKNTLPKVFNTPEIKIAVSEKNKFKVVENIKEKLNNKELKEKLKIKKIIDIDGIRVIFDDAWALVRASNTTPVLVCRFEAESFEKMNEYKKYFLELLENIVYEFDFLSKG